MPSSHSYCLKFADEHEGSPEIEFEADDAFKALEVAHDRAKDRSAELWRDGEKLCSIRRVRGQVWEVHPATAERLARQLPG